jgi:hypothetical protein
MVPGPPILTPSTSSYFDQEIFLNLTLRSPAGRYTHAIPTIKILVITIHIELVTITALLYL